MKRILSTRILKIFFIFSGFIILLLDSCKTPTPLHDIIIEQNNDFFEETGTDEVFRVLIVSDRYKAVQMKLNDSLKRVEDADGDGSICAKLKEYDKIDETSEGVLTVWLYPDTGKIMKIRPKTLASITEINSLIVEDMKRWNFEFSGDSVEPNVFDVKYRVILRKMQSDENIRKEVLERSKKNSKSDD